MIERVDITTSVVACHRAPSRAIIGSVLRALLVCILLAAVLHGLTSFFLVVAMNSDPAADPEACA